LEVFCLEHYRLVNLVGCSKEGASIAKGIPRFHQTIHYYMIQFCTFFYSISNSIINISYFLFPSHLESLSTFGCREKRYSSSKENVTLQGKDFYSRINKILKENTVYLIKQNRYFFIIESSVIIVISDFIFSLFLKEDSNI
jgi:hypothetical protein